MRTKQADKRKSIGRPPKESPLADMARSPAQNHDLTDEDRTKLRNFLSSTDKPFTVTTLPTSRKRKRAGANVYTEQNLDDERLEVQYEIKPLNNWESMKRYKKFTGTRSSRTCRKEGMDTNVV